LSKLVNQSNGYIKLAERETVGLNSCGFGERLVAKSGGQDNELSVSIKGGYILDQLSDDQFLN
jgi:hypothetical protein